MLNELPFALITLAQVNRSEMLSALPDAPVVDEPVRATAGQRVNRSRTVLANRLARFADLVAPRGWVASQRTASR